jgi:enamine deaminase RidA (YjgF/YER057c/UK114 family)
MTFYLFSKQAYTITSKLAVYPMKYLMLCLFLLSFISCRNVAQETPVSGNATLPEQNVETRLAAIGIQLPPVSPPIANYVNSVRTGNLVFMAGKGPQFPDGTYITGKVGADLTVEQGYEAARLTGINLLAALKAEVGDLNKVVRIVKVLGMVNGTPDFKDHPKVINGFSDLMVEIFGEKGKHARAAVGMGSLPDNIAVEIEMIVEVQP